MQVVSKHSLHVFLSFPTRAAWLKGFSFFFRGKMNLSNKSCCRTGERMKGKKKERKSWS